jgi:hypothetical protein
VANIEKRFADHGDDRSLVDRKFFLQTGDAAENAMERKLFFLVLIYL